LTRSASLVALACAALSWSGASRSAPAGVLPQRWEPAAPGVDRLTLDISGAGEGWNTRIVALRLDPRALRFTLRAERRNELPAWTVDAAPASALVALNAGQFTRAAPWGWVVTGGRELQPPGRGPLSAAIAWDGAGRTRWLEPDEIQPARQRGDVAEAFQSYPVLLDRNGAVPRALSDERLGVDVHHRDGRLAIGMLTDGRLLVALTRFHGFGALSPPVPLGLTVADMAAVMRGLGCRRALALDGGVSAQLMVRENGDRVVWPGWRKVPLGLVAEPFHPTD
jgi:hypothetical protein